MADRKDDEKGDTCNLDNLKNKFEKLREKYDLPEFYELNKLFDIEDVDSDSDFLLRRVRRTIAERISGYSRFVDVILNPSNAPVFFFNLLKKVDNKDKEIIAGVYEIVGNIELEMMGLDLEYSEKKEAEFIKMIVDVFDKKIRPIFLEFLKKMGNHNGLEVKKESRSYFG